MAAAGSCPKCGAPNAPIRIADVEVFSTRICSTCMDVADAAAKAQQAHERQSQLEERWKQLCPALYRLTDPAHPQMDQRILARVLSWTPNTEGKGIGLFGPTGVCKTRMMFLLARQLHFRGVKIEVTRAKGFEHLCQSVFADDPDEKARSKAAMKRLLHAEVILFDDVGKEKFTERVESEFYALLETRTGDLLPTLWTSNLRSAALLRMFSENRGEAIIRRLGEMSECIEISPPMQTTVRRRAA